MKCADTTCGREVKNPGEKYCSSLCAPAEVHSFLKRTKSILKVSSFQRGDGEPLEASDDDEQPTDYEQLDSENAEQQKQDADTGKTPSKLDESNQKPKKGSTGKTQRRAEPDTMNKKHEETLPALSVPQLPLTVEGKLVSMNLIDDSLLHLHGLMKSVKANLPAPKEANAHLDPQTINAACNCAKQISQLLKLKLEHSPKKSNTDRSL